MPSDPSPAKEKKKGRWRRPLKWASWGLLGLLVFVVVFHGPLLRWTLNSVAPGVAKKAGYDLQWHVEGTVVSTLKVQNLKLQSPATSSLKSVEAGELEADYSLWSLMREGTANFLHSVRASDVTVTIDSRIKTPPRPKSKGFPDYWVEKLDLRNVNFTML